MLCFVVLRMRCRCLYPPACNQSLNTDQLKKYSNMLGGMQYSKVEAVYMSAQCAHGYEGNLCGRCALGYGRRLSPQTGGPCRTCASHASIVAIYLLAALASMSFIKLLCFLNANLGTVLAARASNRLASAASAASTTVQRGNAGKQHAEPNPREEQPDAYRRSSDQNAVTAPSAASPFAEAAQQPGPGMAAARSSAQQCQGVGQPAVQQPQACLGDLMKPFVIYLQVCCCMCMPHS